MKNTIKSNNLTKADTDKFVKLIDELSKQSDDSGFLDLDYLDQIPEHDDIDKPIPFPFGGHGEFGKWRSQSK